MDCVLRDERRFHMRFSSSKIISAPGTGTMYGVVQYDKLLIPYRHTRNEREVFLDSSTGTVVAHRGKRLKLAVWIVNIQKRKLVISHIKVVCFVANV